MIVEGSRSNNNTQIEDHNHDNVFGNGNRNRDKETDTVKQSNGRKYKVGVQKDMGTLQTTLNEFWIGKEKDMRTWSEEMEELEGLDHAQEKASQKSTLSYV